VRVTDLGEFVRYHSCERRLKLNYDRRAASAVLSKLSTRLLNDLEPVPIAGGRDMEAAWETDLQQAGLMRLNTLTLIPRDQRGQLPWAAFVDPCRNLPTGQNAYAREVEVTGTIGAFPVQGRIDFVLVLWDGGVTRLRLVECKASRKDQTYQRIQVAVYHILVTGLLQQAPLLVAGQPVAAADVGCVIARIDDQSLRHQSILCLPTLRVVTYEEDVQELLRAGGTVQRVVSAPIDKLPYQIEGKCDDRIFNVHCLPESARQRRHELLGFGATTAASLRAVGVSALVRLASLQPSSLQALRLRQQQTFTERPELLSDKARARLLNVPQDTAAPPQGYPVPALIAASNSQLPLHDIAGQQLIRVCLSVSLDYVEGRIGVLATHVTESASLLNTPFSRTPGARQKQIAWLQELPVVLSPGPGESAAVQGAGPPVRADGCHREEFTVAQRPGPGRSRSGKTDSHILSEPGRDAIADVARNGQAPVHFYVWDRSEIRALMEACARSNIGLLNVLRVLMGCRPDPRVRRSSASSRRSKTRSTAGTHSVGRVGASLSPRLYRGMGGATTGHAASRADPSSSTACSPRTSSTSRPISG
jgi:hypothetical protein